MWGHIIRRTLDTLEKIHIREQTPKVSHRVTGNIDIDTYTRFTVNTLLIRSINTPTFTSTNTLISTFRHTPTHCHRDTNIHRFYRCMDSVMRMMMMMCLSGHLNSGSKVNFYKGWFLNYLSASGLANTKTHGSKSKTFHTHKYHPHAHKHTDTQNKLTAHSQTHTQGV